MHFHFRLYMHLAFGISFGIWNSFQITMHHETQNCGGLTQIQCRPFVGKRNTNKFSIISLIVLCCLFSLLCCLRSPDQQSQTTRQG
ncbi:hypothetical protein JZ751_013834 [Albula glossodonta]|uniref:Uncharacterized protein n=1 Tax=Albula glossodonta TaxID=121402 RepID=A0A8T2NRW1_9TELE|nr:hypothetical protein JZ751_013834 [Albula glossodonta]